MPFQPRSFEFQIFYYLSKYCWFGADLSNLGTVTRCLITPLALSSCLSSSIFKVVRGFNEVADFIGWILLRKTTDRKGKHSSCPIKTEFNCSSVLLPYIPSFHLLLTFFSFSSVLLTLVRKLSVLHACR